MYSWNMIVSGNKLSEQLQSLLWQENKPEQPVVADSKKAETVAACNDASCRH